MKRGRPAPPVAARPTAIRQAYVDHPEGAAGYYAERGADYRNPHEAGVREVVQGFAPRFPEGRILDLACGSGEVTLALRDIGIAADRIDGADPHTGAAYLARTGQPALPWSFDDLAPGLPRTYGTVVCSFALHLCERSRLPAVVVALAQAAETLLVVSPHKRPVLGSDWGFVLVEEQYAQLHRVRSRWYRSALLQTPLP